MSTVNTGWIELPTPAGPMRAYSALPAGRGRLPGLMVFQEAFGVNHHIRDVAERFAQEGFVVVAPELYHRTAAPGFECGYGDFAAVAPHRQGITPQGLADDARACWDWLQANPRVDRERIACVGYCLGGRTAFVANTALPFRAAVSYYGGGLVPDLIQRAPDLRAPMLFFWGGQDPHIPPEHVRAAAEALRAAKKPFVNVEVSDAGHGFFCDEREAFNPAAARESWALTLAFLREKGAWKR
ncbi:MAG TPA: dienelactone hydrolase family protein [Opitutaceae bacterium]|nr:dienelactone hydrolase family protein [Opitutaceae bacterium]